MGLGFGFGFEYTPKTHTQKTQKNWVKPKTHTQKPNFFGFIPKTHTQIFFGLKFEFFFKFSLKLFNPFYYGYKILP